MYTVIELQTNGGTTALLTYQFADRDEAESKFHNILSYAAISTVEIHAVSILDPLGDVVKNDRYYHNNVVEMTPVVSEETTEE